MRNGASIDISEAHRQLSSLDERLSSSQPIIYVTRHNKKAFAVVDLEFLGALLETMEVINDPESHATFLQGLKDAQEGRLHDHDEVEKELG